MEVDEAQPPSMLHDPANPSREIYLNWSGAIDDEGHLRRCPLCGCEEFFVRKDLPQVTAFVLVLITAAIAVALFAANNLLAALLVLVIVTVLDVLIFFFAKRNLVCYRCRSEFAGVPIARNQQPWQAHLGERYRQGEAAPHPGYENLAQGDFPTPPSEAQGADDADAAPDHASVPPGKN